MLIFLKCHDIGKQKKSSIVAIFGIGLIGSCLARTLKQYQYETAYNLPFSWQHSSHRIIEKEDIKYCIRRISNNVNGTAFHDADSQCRIDFVWSAGKGGFDIKQNDTTPEMDSFSEVLEMALAVSRENPSSQVGFHMVSSAGGLFEGQRNVEIASEPSPRRPYAIMKLAQENILNDCDGLVRFIYQPTSVYGFAGLNRRMGLIPTLLWNGSKNKVSTIFGAPETLRDYVWVGDIGNFMAGMISSKTSVSNRFILASGKPSALFEVVNRIENTLNKKLFCHYIKSGGNAEHNTFSPKTHPVGWNPLDMETGIRKTHNGIATGFDYIQ